MPRLGTAADAIIGSMLRDRGPRLASFGGHTTGWTVLSWAMLLCVPGGVVVGLSVSGWAQGWLIALIASPLLIGVVLYAIWAESSALHVHERGVIVGRRFLGSAARRMRFEEIHPACIRVFSGIDDIRSPPNRILWPRWYIGLGSNLAVTFLGPSPHVAEEPHARPPAPGPGLIIFGTHDAHAVAAHLRAGLERAGCPPYLARWTERLPVEAASVMRSRIPGYDVRWRP